MPLEHLLATSDIVTLHVHLDDQTRGMIGAAQLAMMKPGAYLVNTSRGAVIDEPALIDALRSGRLAGAGLDVICDERDSRRSDRPLLQYAAAHENLVITPHVGGCTLESQHKAVLYFAEKLRRTCCKE